MHIFTLHKLSRNTSLSLCTEKVGTAYSFDRQKKTVFLVKLPTTILLNYQHIDSF